MTDTADIAALREAALKATPGSWKLGIGSTYAYVQASIDMKLGGKSFVKLCHLGRAGWRNQQSTIDDTRFIALANPATILAILDQLEAARQRADEFEKKFRDELGKRLIGEVVVESALKGDQVPYGYYSAETEAILEQQGYASISVEPLADSRFPLFTAPQKPVLHLDTKRMDWLCSHVVEVRKPLFYGSHSMFWSQCDSDDCEDHHTTLRAQVDAAIEAAGGIVKDGE